ETADDWRQFSRGDAEQHQAVRPCGGDRQRPTSSHVSLSMLRLLDVGQWPSSIKVRFRGGIKTEVAEPELIRHCLHPITFFAVGRRGPEIYIDRSILVRLQSLGP